MPFGTSVFKNFYAQSYHNHRKTRTTPPPRSFNMKTIAQDLVRMLSFKLLYKAPELTVGKVTYTTTLLSRPDGKIDLR